MSHSPPAGCRSHEGKHDDFAKAKVEPMSEIWQPIHATHVVHGYAMQKAKSRDYEDGRLLSICDISYVGEICQKIKIKGLHSTGNRQAERLYTTSKFLSMGTTNL